MRIRIGGVPFGVGAPLLAGLADDPTVDLRREVPARLIERLRRGELDAALVSSIEAFRRPGYRVVGSLGIGCRGPVRSVRAFRRRGAPIRRAGVDAGSETSVALLHVLLRQRLGAEESCTFERVTPTLAPASLPHDVVLLIGDHGLRADPGDREALDLGELWHEWTGLPFVFALWLLSPGADAAAIVPRLRAAREAAVRQGVEDGTGGAIHYDLRPEHWRGLMRFRDEAAAVGRCEIGIVPERVDHDGRASEAPA